MTRFIKKIKMLNYKCFKEYVFIPKEGLNILIGGNDTGKSTLLEALNIVLSGSIKKIESIGLENIINTDAVNDFELSERNFENLPVVKIELFLSEMDDPNMCGKNNSENINCDGIKMVCEPNEDYRNEIKEVLDTKNNYIPLEYYKIKFSTFADSEYLRSRKKMKYMMIDSMKINTEYAINDYYKKMYYKYTEENEKERLVHRSEYRQMKHEYNEKFLKDLNSRIPSEKNTYFGLKDESIYSFDDDLALYENKIRIDNKGMGEKTVLKTFFALDNSKENNDVILIEEPENHLSHINLRKIVSTIKINNNQQIFIATHNSFICTRLDLNNVFIISSKTFTPTSLDVIKKDTADYFMKAPPAGIIEFILSEKIILVEGPSEYILFEKFYKKLRGKIPEDEGVQIIDVRGLSFKRYLDVAQHTHNKVAVITDNDEDFQKNCVNKYSDYSQFENIQIFYIPDNNIRTFEIALYEDNKTILYDQFGIVGAKELLSNKTDSAYRLLTKDIDLEVPDYIKRAIEWINN